MRKKSAKTKAKHIHTLVFISLALCLSLIGCQKQRAPITKTGIYFDTVISITLYEKNSSELIDDCFAIAEKYDTLFSKTNSESDVSKINNSYNTWVEINPETFDVIKTGISYEEISDGRFSVMCGALTDLWDIPNANIPADAEIKSAIAICGKDTIELDENTHSVKITKEGAKLDLGAVAKGYIADCMKDYLLSQNVDSGIIQLGGNVLLIGENPTKADGNYTIGISKPFSETSEVITGVTTSDKSIVTSGNYQRYFEMDGKIYHHIIDLTTGYPADTGLNSVTIICNKSVDADCLSTVCFLLGKEKGADLIHSLNSTVSPFEAIFISDSNEIIQ